MIKLIKKINYYNKKTFSHFSEVDKINFESVENALDFLKNYDIKNIINKKDISSIEEIYFIIKNKNNNLIKYTKTIDFITEKEILTIPDGGSDNV